MVPSEYANFFMTTATAGGALIGLLFVAISLAPEQTVYARAPVEVRVVSSSTFIALFNAFFLSLGALLPYTNIGWFALSLGLIGVINSLNYGRLLLTPLPSWLNVLRRIWLTALSLCLYLGELVYSIQLLFSPTNGSLVYSLGLIVLLNYGIALLRAWELLGVQRTGLFAWLNPLSEVNNENRKVSTHLSEGKKKDTLSQE